MANVFVEARPKGRPEGTHIDDYVVETDKDHVLHTSKTQKEAIDWAKANDHHPLSLASGTSTTKRILITGARLKVGLPAGFDSLFLTTSVNETSVRARLLVVPSKRLNKFLPCAVGPGSRTPASRGCVEIRAA